MVQCPKCLKQHNFTPKGEWVCDCGSSNGAAPLPPAVVGGEPEAEVQSPTEALASTEAEPLTFATDGSSGGSDG